MHVGLVIESEHGHGRLVGARVPHIRDLLRIGDEVGDHVIDDLVFSEDGAVVGFDVILRPGVFACEPLGVGRDVLDDILLHVVFGRDVSEPIYELVDSSDIAVPDGDSALSGNGNHHRHGRHESGMVEHGVLDVRVFDVRRAFFQGVVQIIGCREICVAFRSIRGHGMVSQSHRNPWMIQEEIPDILDPVASAKELPTYHVLVAVLVVHDDRIVRVGQDPGYAERPFLKPVLRDAPHEEVVASSEVGKRASVPLEHQRSEERVHHGFLIGFFGRIIRRIERRYDRVGDHPAIDPDVRVVVLYVVEQGLELIVFRELLERVAHIVEHLVEVGLSHAVDEGRRGFQVVHQLTMAEVGEVSRAGVDALRIAHDLGSDHVRLHLGRSVRRGFLEFEKDSVDYLGIEVVIEQQILQGVLEVESVLLVLGIALKERRPSGTAGPVVGHERLPRSGDGHERVKLAVELMLHVVSYSDLPVVDGLRQLLVDRQGALHAVHCHGPIDEGLHIVHAFRVHELATEVAVDPRARIVEPQRVERIGAEHVQGVRQDFDLLIEIPRSFDSFLDQLFI